MRALRIEMLTKGPQEFDIAPSEQFSRVYGVVMDWPIDGQTVSVIGFCDGNASLYTTGTFGILGGASHESVRAAAQDLVRAAEPFHDVAQSTRDLSYPDPGTVRFYFLTFTGARMIEVPESKLSTGTEELSSVWSGAQRLITALHNVSEGSPHPDDPARP